MSPEYRAIRRRLEDEALARGETLWWTCRGCGRDFQANHRERYCSKKCRLDAKTAAIESALASALGQAPRAPERALHAAYGSFRGNPSRNRK
jgi:transposase-like protein